MDYIKELRIVRVCIKIMLVATTVWIVFDEYIDLSKYETKPTLDSTSVDSGFGKITLFNPGQSDALSNNIYQNKNLGFQILKPNNSWNIRSMSDESNGENIPALKAKGFLDGIYLNQNNNTRFMITVFDINQKSFNLSNYIDTQINLMKDKLDVDIPIKQVSSSNDWAIFGIEIHSKKQDDYGEQLLYLKNNRLYMLQYSGPSPSEIDLKIKSEYRSIIDSFELLR